MDPRPRRSKIEKVSLDTLRVPAPGKAQRPFRQAKGDEIAGNFDIDSFGFHHTAGKAITSTGRWPRSWTTTAARSSGNRMGRASRQTQVTLLKWQQQYRRWPDPDALLAKWEKYYSRYHTSHGEPWGSEPA